MRRVGAPEVASDVAQRAAEAARIREEAQRLRLESERNMLSETIANLHEQGAAIAAEAYAKVTNQLGVLMVTTGPGGNDTLTFSSESSICWHTR